jgi:benzoyl-CoA reductase/2-hydroxyglutaryl-CoA dehydratase subunit BcrC/BadD/HgdB
MQEAPALAARRRRRDVLEGREVVGWFSPPIPPPELIEAAGAIPWRLLESGGPDADLPGMGVLGRDTCSFCRSVLGAAIQAPPPVTCIVSGTVCDRLRHMTDAWPAATGLPMFTVTVPRTREVAGQLPVLAAELRLLARELSARTGIVATDERLAEAIGRGNRCREVLAALDELRAGDPPRLTGTGFLDVVRARHALSAVEFLELADGLLEAVRSREPAKSRPVRVLLVGPTLTDGSRDVVRIAEEDCGAAIVADLTDSGSLGYADPVAEGGDPFAALAKMVLDHPILAAPLRPATAFRNVFLTAIRRSRPDGILYRGVPFCRPFNSEAVPLRELSPVPFLDVRVEASGADGQQRTRVGAFLEAIEARRQFRREGGR